MRSLLLRGEREPVGRCWACPVTECTVKAYGEQAPKCLRHGRRMTETCRTGHQL